jgi:predicted HTH domain antitoxin
VESIQIRLDREQLRELKDLEKEFKRSRSEVTRRALAEGLRVMKMELALERYGKEEITLVRAAQFAGVSISQMADAAAGRGIHYFRYPASELELDANKLRGKLK